MLQQDRRIPVTEGTDYEIATPLNTGTLIGAPTAAPDPAELVELFQRVAMPFIDRLYAAAVQMTRDRRDAEDLIQETYLRAFDAFGSLTWQTDPRMWLFRVLADTACDACGERQRPARSSSPTRRPIGRLSGTGRPTLHVPQTAQAQALGRLSDHAVKVALQQLPLKLAIVVYLAYVEDFSHVEIAEILSIPASTAKSRLHYGRRCLQGLLTDAARQRGLLSRTINGSVEASVTS
ncbi:sigma-70 family RNA polymerase sigma factor [Streptomyces chiangmaiensis]|uniref:Sigma-70 family RNA polymerase sigma factor n=1 Tax=Streptomyces chiangmaiensis TaxID=766497 RepID=A0ABU7FX24_9ACTN|nr:sigma-70 family RNA polymerase sigma factor [Streptomyces chiangmaiensis]MED7828599.1 sigma-70 family RNA polymerase sigma factor [Streptomyces chiangmaiensis]